MFVFNAINFPKVFIPIHNLRLYRYSIFLCFNLSIFLLICSFQCYASELQKFSYAKRDRLTKWSVAEISLTSNKTFSNPYTEVEVNGTFYGPHNNILNVKGFWDGNQSYKIRFTPTAEGLWKFVINSSPFDAGLNRKGYFDVKHTGRSNQGFLRRDNIHTRSFIFDDGTRYLMVGQTYYSIIRRAYQDSEWFEAIEECKHYGFNKIRILSWPWNRQGTLPKPTPFQNHNHDRIDIRYFKKLDEIITRCFSTGMIVDLILWKDSPQAHGTIEQDFRYVKYLLARYAAFPNIIWTLANEWEYSGYGPGKEWYWNQMGDFIRTSDPWFTHGNRLRLLSIHQQTFHSFKWAQSEWPVHAIIQDGVWNGLHEPPRFANGDEWGNYGILKNLHLEIPVVNDELGYFGQKYTHQGISTRTDRSHLRRAMWGIYIAGGYGSLGDNTVASSFLERGKEIDIKPRGKKVNPARVWLTGPWHYIPVYEDVKNLVSFFKSKKIPYWKMVSQNNLIKEGTRVYVLADIDNEYVVYTANGNSFAIKLPNKIFRFDWYHPVMGTTLAGGTTSQIGPHEFTPPFEGDAVLHIYGVD